MLECLSAVAQLTWQIGTDIQLVLANRLLVVHVVKRRDFMHGHGGHTQKFSHHGFTLGAHIAGLLLDNRQARHDCGLLLVLWVFGNFLSEAHFGFFGNHRSTSPNTISNEPIMATASPIMCPRPISPSAARCTKAG